MNRLIAIATVALIALLPMSAGAQSEARSETDSLKIAALEALISAPPGKALPRVRRVLAGDNSDEVKARALFILGQIETPDAQAILQQLATGGEDGLKLEAIRTIGIGGDEAALASLAPIYREGDEETRSAVLEAYLIAGDRRAVFDIVASAGAEEDVSEAIEILAAMGGHEELRELHSRRGMSQPLIEAYAVAGDFETLRELALDDADAGLQTQAIEALGIVGGDAANGALVEIYRGSASDEVRAAALDGMLISRHDSGVLELYRSAGSDSEKRQLMEYLVMMNSESVWEVIDSALDSQP